MAKSMGTKHQPKLVTLMNKKLKNIEKCQNKEDRFALAQMCFHELASQLVTFGPVLKVLQNEYESKIGSLERSCLVEQKCKEM